jgi:hypothetical protein
MTFKLGSGSGRNHYGSTTLIPGFAETQTFLCTVGKKKLEFSPFNFFPTFTRVQPARGWFSNTKVISQSALQKFQEEMGNIKKVNINYH